MFFKPGGGRSPGFAGAFVESLVFDAVFAYTRMQNPHPGVGRTTRNETEWEIYTDVRAPRGALSYPRFNREELKGGSWV